MVHSDLSSFYWDSPLSDERKKDILAWLKTLSKDQQEMIEDLIQDIEFEKSFSESEDQ